MQNKLSITLLRKGKEFFKGIYPILILLLVWELVYAQGEVKNMKFFPPPTVFLAEVYEDGFMVGIGAQATSITYSILSSILRVFAGLLIGFSSAILIGLLISTTRFLTSLVMPVISFMAPIAPIAWIPLAIVLFGVGNQAAIFIVFMGVFFMLTIATVDALEKVPNKLIDKAYTRGANSFQVWFYLKIPFILPAVFTILRLNFIAAWMAVLAAEMTGLNDGLGNIFMTGRNLYNYDLIMLGMFLIAVVGFLFDLFLKKIQRTFFWWTE